MTDLVATRRSLHAVAELLIAGPQHTAHDTVRLRVLHGGFGSSVGPDVRVEGSRLNKEGTTYALDGRTLGDVAAEAGIALQPLGAVYKDATGADADTLLQVDPARASTIAAA